MVFLRLVILGFVVIIGSIVISNWLEVNLNDPSESTDYNFKDSIPIIETIGIIAGGSLLVIGFFKKKS